MVEVRVVVVTAPWEGERGKGRKTGRRGREKAKGVKTARVHKGGEPGPADEAARGKGEDSKGKKAVLVQVVGERWEQQVVGAGGRSWVDCGVGDVKGLDEDIGVVVQVKDWSQVRGRCLRVNG